ncbi:MAG: cupin domain-containing protein [Candidatus Nanopelagicales bacterium]
MTHPTTGALASLLGPTSAADFAADVWSQRLLHRSAAPGERLTDLLTLDDVDTLLASHALRTPFLRVAKDGVVVPASAYTRSGGIGASIADQVDADRLAALLADGSTLVLQGLHRAWPRVQALVTDLTVDLGHPVQANAYLTPPAAQGFSAHYDTHDVVVVQLAGTKHWTVHPPAVPVETGLAEWTQHRDAVAAAAQGEPAYDGPLAPGDVLYLPRGWIHAARANDTMSLHLTLGIHPFTGRHVLDAAVAEALAALPVHASLPVGVDVADPAHLERVLEEVRRLSPTGSTPSRPTQWRSG